MQTKYRLWTKGTMLYTIPRTQSVLKKYLRNGTDLKHNIKIGKAQSLKSVSAISVV